LQEATSERRANATGIVDSEHRGARAGQRIKKYDHVEIESNHPTLNSSERYHNPRYGFPDSITSRGSRVKRKSSFGSPAPPFSCPL
ncbi:MAG: hypothetical protein LC772_13335, partial [Chloroflexi bacterium]|nr:hypothetical protein [Chloroflexota bacterium]